MTIKIAIIATNFLSDFISSALASLSLPFEYQLYSYGSFADLTAIYESLPNNVSGVVTSGFFPCEILRRCYPDSARIIHAFNNDHADLFKLFFHLQRSNGSLTLERMYVDLLDILGMSTQEYLNKPLSISLDSRLEQQACKYSMADLMGMEQTMRDTHLRLWQQGLVDASVTRFSGIVKPLHEAGLPVHFVYPNRAYLESVFLRTIQATKLRFLHDNQAAAIVITVAKNCPPELIGSKQAELQRALAMFFSLTPMHLVARPMERGLEILISRKGLDFLTERFSTCKLLSFFQNNLNFIAHVGYGLGETVHQARINAIDANREASLAAEGSSCLINESGQLIFPLRSDKPFVISRAMSPQIQDLAMRSGLSSLTLQKIEAAISAAVNRQITSEDLAEKLSITKRSANRILSTLRNSGAAQVVSLQRGTTRGRPERVYQIAPM